MIETCRGNLLTADVQALVNTVNCVGTMGKGIALQFKEKFPWIMVPYKRACRTGQLTIGRVQLLPIDNDHFIINFPTKTHWRYPSHLDYVRAGLPALVDKIKEWNIKSIAIPALGCGNGGLDWDLVKPLIEQHLAQLKDVRVLLYEPET